MEEHTFHTVTSEWNDSIENTLKEIGSKCLGYKWMNIFSVYHTFTFNRLF